LPVWKVLVSVLGMSNDEALDRLATARTLQDRATTSTRWFVRFLVVLGIGELLYSSLVGIAPAWVIAASSIPWALFVTLICVWANRQSAVPRFAGAVMGVWAGGFACLWGAVVFTGTQVEPSWRPVWFIGGGLVVAAWSWGLALWMHRRGTRQSTGTGR